MNWIIKRYRAHMLMLTFIGCSTRYARYRAILETAKDFIR